MLFARKVDQFLTSNELHLTVYILVIGLTLLTNEDLSNAKIISSEKPDSQSAIRINDVSEKCSLCNCNIFNADKYTVGSRSCQTNHCVGDAHSKPTEVAIKLEPWDPNYCNDSKLQDTAGLTKTALGQFLGYPCDPTFFHCRWSIDGWKTYKKLCRKGLVYDRIGTQNCNYDFNVEGCGSKQCADCLDDQYACCLSEECVDLGKRCDGSYDCALEEDEQNCPTCGAAEFPCVLSEQCIAMEKRCNGIKECKDGTDEMYCNDCPASMFYCRSSKKCVEKELRCDGKRDCNSGEDEAFCSTTTQKDYLCENQQDSIPMRDLCNGFPDCPDGSDEFYCGGLPIEFEEIGHPKHSLRNISFVAAVANVTLKPASRTASPPLLTSTLRSSNGATAAMPTVLPKTAKPGSTRKPAVRMTVKPQTATATPNRRNSVSTSATSGATKSLSIVKRNESNSEDYFYEQ